MFYRTWSFSISKSVSPVCKARETCVQESSHGRDNLSFWIESTAKSVAACEIVCCTPNELQALYHLCETVNYHLNHHKNNQTQAQLYLVHIIFYCFPQYTKCPNCLLKSFVMQDHSLNPLKSFVVVLLTELSFSTKHWLSYPLKRKVKSENMRSKHLFLFGCLCL